MATLKKLTRVGADVRQIAKLLQAKAPEGHMLAYITPEEAKLLKSQGGSGKEHADTGIPSFEVGDSYGFTEDTAFDYGPVTQEPAPPPAFNPAQPAASFDPGQFAPAPSAAPVADTSFRGPPTPDFLPSADRAALYGPVGYGAPASPTELAPFDTSRAAPEKGIMDTLVEKTGLSKETLARLGLAAGGSLYGAYQGKKAQEQGQAAKREQQALAEPYRAKGAELQRQAQAGELTPVGQQQLQAVQAQAAQQASGRGGAVSAAQTQAQIENFRNQLLQQQYDYGLKLSGIGDNIALGAIKTGLEADRYVQNLSNSFYTNMANIAGGMPAQAPQQYRSE
jgi:hypothetical protein